MSRLGAEYIAGLPHRRQALPARSRRLAQSLRLDPALLPLIETVRRHTTLPVVVGFGISRPEHLQALQGKADGVIVASALLDAIAQSPGDPASRVREFLTGLRPPP